MMRVIDRVLAGIVVIGLVGCAGQSAAAPTITATVVRATETARATSTETPTATVTITATITQSPLLTPLQAEQYQILNEAAPGAWEWTLSQDVCAFSDLMMAAIRCDTEGH